MKPLSKEARAALSSLQASEPSATDEARVRAGIERTLGLAVPAATLGAATTAKAAAVKLAASGATGLGVGAKGALVFVAVMASTAAVTYSVTRSSRAPGAPEATEARTTRAEPVASGLTPEAVEPTMAPVAPVQPAPGLSEPVEDGPAQQTSRPKTAVVLRSPPPPIAKPTPSAPPEPETPAEPAPSMDLAPPPLPEDGVSTGAIEEEVELHFPTCDAATELRMAQSADRLLSRERPKDALTLLSEYQARCPSGHWSDVAWRVRLASLCTVGKNAEVIGLMQWFTAEYPERRAALADELSKSCSEEVLRRGFAAPR